MRERIRRVRGKSTDLQHLQQNLSFKPSLMVLLHSSGTRTDAQRTAGDRPEERPRTDRGQPKDSRKLGRNGTEPYRECVPTVLQMDRECLGVVLLCQREPIDRGNPDSLDLGVT
jgi:hypothetical protein